MARILFVTQPRSHVHFRPFVPVATSLRALGHEVGWVAMTDARVQQLQGLGVDVIRTSVDHPSYIENIRTETDEQYVESFRKHLLESVDVMYPSVREAVRAYQPDLLVCDATTYTGQIVAQQERITWVTAAVGLITLTEGPPDCNYRSRRLMPLVYPAREKLYALYGVKGSFRAYEGISPYLHIVFTTASFPPAHFTEPPPHTALVGPSLAPDAPEDVRSFPWNLLSGRPMILTEPDELIWWRSPDSVKMLADAAQTLGAQLVVVGGVFSKSAEARELPAGSIVVPSGPRGALLERTSVYVTHGDWISVSHGLSAGVATLVMTMVADQLMVGTFVERLNCGRVLDLESVELTAPASLEALRELLRPDESRQQALLRLSQDLRSQNGGHEAAKRIHALLQGIA